jgi:two-component system, NarL family, sensor kinase
MQHLNALNEERVAIFDSQLRLVAASPAWAQFRSPLRLGIRSADRSEDLLARFQLPSRLPGPQLVNLALGRMFAGTQNHLQFSYLCSVNRAPRIYEFSMVSMGQAERLRIKVRHRDLTTRHDSAVILPLIADYTDSIREEERRRIAAELHDSTSQHLVAINLNVMNLKHALDKDLSTDELIETIEKSAQAAQDEIRISSYALFPIELGVRGLKSTLQEYLVGFARRTQLDIKFRIPSRVDAIPVALQLALLRIVQEALSNVYRHACAHHAAVTIVLKHRFLTLKIADDGHGIPTPDTDGGTHRGVGISSMTARLREFDGSLHLTSSSKGTTLIADVPVRSAVAPSTSHFPAVGLRGTESRALQA